MRCPPIGCALPPCILLTAAHRPPRASPPQDLRIPSMRLVKQQLGWEPKTTLKQAMEMTMKVFIEKYADKLAGLKRASDAAAPAALALFVVVVAPRRRRADNASI